MKTLQQFLESYSDLRAKARARQQAHNDASVQRTQAELSKRKNAQRKADQMKAAYDAAKENVKKEYGIKGD